MSYLLSELWKYLERRGFTSKPFFKFLLYTLLLIWFLHGIVIATTVTPE